MMEMEGLVSPAAGGKPREAKRLVVCALGALCLLYSSTALALPTVRTMYTEALAREQAVRDALEAGETTPALLADLRAVVASYEAVVRRYPASSYSDNALWQAGRLSLDAFARFGEAADKDAAVRLLRRLTEGYPSSRLVEQVPAQLARIEMPAIAIRPFEVIKAGPSVVEGRPAQDERSTPAAKLTTIKQIRRTVLPDAVRITIDLDGEVPFHDERISDPSRVFVDLPGTRAARGLLDRTIRFEHDADVVRQVRIGRHPNDTTRVVLDVAGVTSYSVYPLYNPYRLVIDCVRPPDPAPAAAVAPSAAPAAATVAAKNPPSVPVAARPREAPPLTARRLAGASLQRLPSAFPRRAKLITAAHAADDAATASVAVPTIVELEPTAMVGPAIPAPRPLPAERTSAGLVRENTDTEATIPARNLNGGFSIARQLGLGISRIVIDPGHGGHDPGAKSKGVTEAEVVLDVALRLEKLLEKTEGVEVILTRRTDEFIALPERTAIANREGADLFLSIHANASPNAQASGVETYFLNFANNLTAAAVAARENAASGQQMGALPDLVKSIALTNKLDESRDLATHVQRAMVARLRTTNKSVRDLGVKQAPFVVLIGAAMPSVLAEISFVTNVQEARLLKGTVYRQRIAESLFNAIRKYQGSLKDAKAIALQ
jgi:N-acetylmuramoyl-L-alanine amidase